MWNRPAVGVEIFETRVLLTSYGLMPIASAEVDSAVTQHNQVLTQYSAPVQQQYLQPVQSTLESAASSFIAETASMSSNAEITNDWSGTPVERKERKERCQGVKGVRVSGTVFGKKLLFGS